MNQMYFTILDSTINKAIQAAKNDYKNSKDKLEGSVAGLEACRKLSIKEIHELFITINLYKQEAAKKRHENYWFFRCYEAEILFIQNRMKNYIVNF